MIGFYVNSLCFFIKIIIIHNSYSSVVSVLHFYENMWWYLRLGKVYENVEWLHEEIISCYDIKNKKYFFTYNIIHVTEEIRCVRYNFFISLERVPIGVPGTYINNVDEIPPVGGSQSLFEHVKRWTCRLVHIVSQLRG